jgi:hypothetical protein
MSVLSGIRLLARARPQAGLSALYSTTPAAAPASKPPRVYGNLKDEDRIFQNLYGRHDWNLKGAMKRVCKLLSDLNFIYDLKN